MSTMYHAACLDCKESIALDKFYGWNHFDGYRWPIIISQEILDGYKTDGWIARSMLLHWFINLHGGHRISMFTEHDNCPGGALSGIRDKFPWSGEAVNSQQYKPLRSPTSLPGDCCEECGWIGPECRCDVEESE